MRLPGWKRVRHLHRWLRAHWRGGAIVLGYHRIADCSRDPYGLCVSPANFLEQLEVLRSLSTPMRLSDVVDRSRCGSLPPRPVAITFDDGYADVLHAALPALEQWEIPATVFVVSMGAGDEFWWDTLERVTLGRTPESPVEQADGAAIGSSSVHAIEELLRAHESLSRLRFDERSRALQTLGDTQPREDRENTARSMTREELSSMAASRLIDIGGHTRTHPYLPSLPPEVQREEIAGCRADLEELLDHRVDGFSYPHGAVSNQTAALVRSAGFHFACSSDNDLLYPSTDSFRIPRFWARNEGGDRFSHWIRRWLHD